MYIKKHIYIYAILDRPNYLPLLGGIPSDPKKMFLQSILDPIKPS